MGQNQSLELPDDGEEVFVDSSSSPGLHQSPAATWQGSSSSSGKKPAAPASGPSGHSNKPTVKVYKHSAEKWTVCGSQPWIFAKLSAVKSKEVEDAETEEEEENEEGNPLWHLLVGEEIRALIDPILCTKFNDDQFRVDFNCKGVWALRFPDPLVYQKFVTMYRDSLFENTHGLTATDANRLKILGKDFTKWGEGEDGDESMWDAEDTFESPERITNIGTELHETLRGTPKGKGVQSISMGIGDKSYLLHSSGIDLFLNREQGLEATDSCVPFLKPQSSGLAFTPKKGLLMHRENTMMLMSPAKVDNRATGVHQLDLGTGTVVANWAFQKDGVDLKMLDISGDSKSAQMDPSSTFLGLDSNSLCRWDARTKEGRVQDIASSSDTVLAWNEGHMFSKGTNFQCFATTGSGAIAVGSKDGKIRLYGTTSVRQAKTSFPGLGQPITHIDVTYDGKWVVATTDSELIVLSTVFKDKSGREKTGFEARMGSNIAAPRLLKLNPVDAHQAGEGARFQNAMFSWVTEADSQERNIVATVGQYSVIWNFRRVKQTEHPCYQQQAQGLKACYCYKVVPKDNTIVESRFMHDSHTGSSSPAAPLVVATPDLVSSFNV